MAVQDFATSSSVLPVHVVDEIVPEWVAAALLLGCPNFELSHGVRSVLFAVCQCEAM